MIVNDNSDGDAAHFIGDADAPGGGTQEQRSTKTASLNCLIDGEAAETENWHVARAVGCTALHASRAASRLVVRGQALAPLCGVAFHKQLFANRYYRIHCLRQLWILKGISEKSFEYGALLHHKFENGRPQ
jgi:hypothetical protein